MDNNTRGDKIIISKEHFNAIKNHKHTTSFTKTCLIVHKIKKTIGTKLC